MARKPAPKKDTESDTLPIQTLKKATCKNLAGTSTLTYLIGTSDTGKLYWKIAENSGGGMFSLEWVAFTDIQSAIEDWGEDKPITSLTLRPLFRGKSVNTPAFLLAALVRENLLEPMPKKKRCHAALGPQPFLTAMKAIQAGEKPKRRPAAKSKAKAKRSPARKKAAPVKK